MMGEGNQEVRTVFVGAAALDRPEERARYLDDACEGRPDLSLRSFSIRAEGLCETSG